MFVEDSLSSRIAGERESFVCWSKQLISEHDSVLPQSTWYVYNIVGFSLKLTCNFVRMFPVKCVDIIL